ncbi:regulator of chromosome condensation 1/beta-lactamase-inhibitor protein II [Podospora australis]|uniref:Regulator of chromosome condensation 1/beta-lactamase-inhibitor protein II n=1 Tax=Podospora australis TaxID=1536484 RepID=A0AAN7AKM1_9PEZI|nr:regulator of chromosome condensation 1/beta-lactamase-inhibitor protein II [Podospora australis]
MASSAMYNAALRQTAARTTVRSHWVRYRSYKGQVAPPPPPMPRRTIARAAGLLTALVVSGAAAAYLYPTVTNTDTKQPELSGPEKAELVFEKPRKTSTSKEGTRDLVSPQHVQVKQSLERPGVYAWGSNAGKVAAPDSKETNIKTPRRISYFDGQVLRDLKLERDFGAAVNEKGDLVQWGVGFSKETPTPQVTLKGKDIQKIAVSKDRVIALSNNGSVYSIPVAKQDQILGEKQVEPSSSSSSWFPFWSEAASSATHYRSLKPANLGWKEKVVDIKSGLEHCLLLTSNGRVFSAASSTEEFPSRGQLGIPGLTWQTRPAGPYDQPHEVEGLRGSKVKSIAAGDYHSLALDSDGQVFAFGDNTVGQLGIPPDFSVGHVDKPSPLPIKQLYSGTNLRPKVTSIAAGGLNSFFTVDATKTQSTSGRGVTPSSELGKVVAETWACGSGVHGELGTGKWLHVSEAPSKIKALSDLYEYNESSNTLVPIRLSRLAVGSTHACAVLDNVTHLTASNKTSADDTNFGADVLFWGGNEAYQLGTGKRNNINSPTHVGPLVGSQGEVESGRSRMQLTPRTTVKLTEGGKTRSAKVEQRVECGRMVSAVYSGV